MTIALFSIISLLQLSIAQMANSSNYSVERFTLGSQGGNVQGDSYEGRYLTYSYQPSTRNAESSAYTVNVGFFDNTTYTRTVSIQSYSISPRSAVIGSTIGLSISALNHDSVWARVISPNNQIQSISLVNNQNVEFLPSPSVVGRYNVTFFANSSTGAVASAIDYFEYTAQAASSPSSGSSGSSGGSSSSPGSGPSITVEKCTYNWQCRPWSRCRNDIRTRKCTNYGTCTDEENKPFEVHSCENNESLFDIFLKINDKEIYLNNSIKFEVTLIETLGIEKIDVQIKYTIIDEKNAEYFSQIETRAVLNRLTYEKKLEDLKLENGTYTIRVDIIYGNEQRANADQKFNVGKLAQAEAPEPIIIKEEIRQEVNRQLITLYIFLSLTIISSIIAYSVYNWRKKP